MIRNKFYYNPLPEELEIGESEIDGHGIFATTEIEEGHDLGPTHIKMPIYSGFVSRPWGVFINHDEEPNCYLSINFEWDDYKIFHLFTRRKILEGEELLLDYDE